MTARAGGPPSGPGRNVRVAVWWTLLAVWAACVWTLSASSHPAEDIHWRWAMPDKVAHGLEYAVGGFLARGAFAASGARWSPWALAVLLCAAWGFTDEIHQGFVPGRETDPLDLLADVTGASLGAAIHAAVAMLPGRLPPWARRSR